jgi:UDP-N-acetylmuramyl pentapeptide phosphotransferase/UDP-N-acetylglucosamine-1-phosphate transferase
MAGRKARCLILLFASGFVISFLSQWLALLLANRSGYFIDRVDVDKPQGIHSNDTPRCGGLGIFLGALVLIAYNDLGTRLLIASIPVFLVGFYEDFHRNIPPNIRMSVMSLSVILGMILLKAIVWDVGYFRLFLKFPVFIAVPDGASAFFS